MFSTDSNDLINPINNSANEPIRQAANGTIVGTPERYSANFSSVLLGLVAADSSMDISEAAIYTAATVGICYARGTFPTRSITTGKSLTLSVTISHTVI